MARTRKRRRRRVKNQRGGLLGHVTGFHLSERGVRRILTMNHRVKKRYQEDCRGRCKEDVIYDPDIKFSNSKIDEAFKMFMSENTTKIDLPTLVCGITGNIMKKSNFVPDGKTYVGEGFQNALKRNLRKLYPNEMIF